MTDTHLTSGSAHDLTCSFVLSRKTVINYLSGFLDKAWNDEVYEPAHFGLICGLIVLFVVGKRVSSLKSD